MQSEELYYNINLYSSNAFYDTEEKSNKSKDLVKAEALKTETLRVNKLLDFETRKLILKNYRNSDSDIVTQTPLQTGFAQKDPILVEDED